MSVTSFALVLLAAFIHATWNFLSKRAAASGAAFVFTYNLVSCVVTCRGSCGCSRIRRCLGACRSRRACYSAA